ncbi:hypothetical protein [Pseudomonas sp.]|uniref:hypothetical protein n=1 Tax=Pseudomonas sp. TaxID=306 RepID=UPI0031B5A23B
MLYEKTSDKFSIIDLSIAAIILFIFLLIIGTHGSPTFWNSILSLTAFQGSNATDWINALGQLATAGAFIIAFSTFHLTKKNERQKLLLEESKLTIKRMEDALAKIDTANSNFENIEFVCVCLSNLATDLEAIYGDITDETYKAIVRMHWQNMHFNHLRIAFKNVNFNSVLRNLGVDYREAKNLTKHNTKTPPGINDEYKFYRRALQSSHVAPLLEKRYNDFQNLGHFITSFFDKDKTDDYMHGSMSWLVPEAGVPLVAALSNIYVSNTEKLFKSLASMNKNN